MTQTITVDPPLRCMAFRPEVGLRCNREATVATVERWSDGSYRIYPYCRECVEALQRVYASEPTEEKLSMPTVRKLPPPAAEPAPVRPPLSFKQAADYLRSRGYTVTGDGGSMFLVAREQPVEQRLLDKPGVITQALALRETQIVADTTALRQLATDSADPHAGWLR